MKLNVLEKIVVGMGATALLLYAGSFFVPGYKSFQEPLRNAALVSLALYILYNFLVQSKDQSDLAALEAKVAQEQQSVREASAKIQSLVAENARISDELRKAKDFIKENSLASDGELPAVPPKAKKPAPKKPAPKKPGTTKPGTTKPDTK